MPEPRTITPEKPSAWHSSWLTTAMSTLRCLKMRFSVSSPSMSSSTAGNALAQVTMSASRSSGRSWCTPPGRKYAACSRAPQARS